MTTKQKTVAPDRPSHSKPTSLHHAWLCCEANRSRPNGHKLFYDAQESKVFVALILGFYFGLEIH